MNANVKAGHRAPAVFFQHGLMGSANAWVDHYPDLAPAF
jgi:hypothetical protein